MTALDWLINKSDNPKFTKTEETDKEETTRSSVAFIPDVDICESETDLLIQADMPGIRKEDIKITIDNGVLTIEAVVDLKRYDGLKPIYSEYRIGNYFRRFQLGESIATDKIKAEMSEGVLTLTLPKEAKQQVQKIMIN